jgi:hypothetical protein
MFVVMAYILLCILPLIAVALISIIISRKVTSVYVLTLYFAYPVLRATAPNEV